MIHFGIDIGGTAIKMGAVTPSGEVLARTTRPFPSSDRFEAVLAGLADGYAELRVKAGEPSVVGICSPGYLAQDQGVLIDGGVNVAALRDRPVVQLASARLGLPVHWANDGVAATVGELRFGAGRPFRRLVMLTLGTGVGGCVAIDGEICTGPNGEPPEIGAMVLADGGAARGAGQPGSLESYACAAGFLAAYREMGGDADIGDVRALFAHADRDPAAAATIDRTARAIAQAVGSLLNALALDGCVIGGGIAAAGDALIRRIEGHLPDFAWPLLLRSMTLVPAERGNEAGLIGAAALAADAAGAVTGRRPAE